MTAWDVDQCGISSIGEQKKWQRTEEDQRKWRMSAGEQREHTAAVSVTMKLMLQQTHVDYTAQGKSCP